MKTKSVFDIYAQEYDLITDASIREKNHKLEVAALIERFNPKRVLDAGCANGLTTRLFAERGVESVGLDISRKMVEEANRRYCKTDLPISFIRGDFTRLPKKFYGKFDLVICLANAISGVGSIKSLLASMRSFKNVLKSGGYFVLQALNYKSLKDGELKPIKVTNNDGIIYARYQRRTGKRLEINIIRIDLNEKPITLDPYCHELGNFDIDQLLRSGKSAGFNNLKKYGNLLLDQKFSSKSRDIVLICQK